ncbi:MAG: hypothetical protein MI741_01405 [Rhodospirillales bacterium]|nr:hypothetical protein [Rhodospirillales bacterium]
MTEETGRNTKPRLVRHLMRDLDEYTTVTEQATLKDAFHAMQDALRGVKKSDPNEARDFAVLVLGKDGSVLGRLVVWDVLQGLEPRTIRPIDAMAMVDGFKAWEQPLALLAEKSRNLKVRDLVRPMRREEFIDVEVDIEQALSRLIQGRFFSLIAMDAGKAVGILRVVDVFQYVCESIREVMDG